jgi:hypothetical protein
VLAPDFLLALLVRHTFLRKSKSKTGLSARTGEEVASVTVWYDFPCHPLVMNPELIDDILTLEPTAFTPKLLPTNPLARMIQ